MRWHCRSNLGPLPYKDLIPRVERQIGLRIKGRRARSDIIREADRNLLSGGSRQNKMRLKRRRIDILIESRRDVAVD